MYRYRDKSNRRPNLTDYEQDDAIRTFKLLNTQYDEDCADYAH
jgi:hypothetical protein